MVLYCTDSLSLNSFLLYLVPLACKDVVNDRLSFLLSIRNERAQSETDQC